MPGLRRQGEELRCRRGQEACRACKKSCGSATRGRGRRRHLVAREAGAGRAADRLGRGPERQGLQRRHRRDREGGPRRQRGLRRQQSGDAKAAIAGAAKTVEAIYCVSVPEPRAHGADERHGALDRGSVRGLGGDAERRGRARRRGGGLRPAGREMRVYKLLLGGGFGRRGRRTTSAGRAVAKEMPGARSSSSGRARRTCSTAATTRSRSEARRRPGQAGQPCRPAHAHLRPIDFASYGRRACRTAAIRSTSKGSIRVGAEAASAIRSRTC